MCKILRDLSHLVVAYSSNEVRLCALTQCNKKINVNIFTWGWKNGEEASCNNSNNDKLKRSQKAQVPVLNGNEEFTKILLAFILNNSSETSKCILVNFTVDYWLTDSQKISFCIFLIQKDLSLNGVYLFYCRPVPQVRTSFLIWVTQGSHRDLDKNDEGIMVSENIYNLL